MSTMLATEAAALHDEYDDPTHSTGVIQTILKSGSLRPGPPQVSSEVSWHRLELIICIWLADRMKKLPSTNAAFSVFASGGLCLACRHFITLAELSDTSSWQLRYKPCVLSITRCTQLARRIRREGLVTEEELRILRDEQWLTNDFNFEVFAVGA